MKDPAMKNNVELRAALNMVLARLESDPKRIEEWQAIQNALSDSLAYATKVKVMRKRLVDKCIVSPDGSPRRRLT